MDTTKTASHNKKRQRKIFLVKPYFIAILLILGTVPFGFIRDLGAMALAIQFIICVFCISLTLSLRFSRLKLYSLLAYYLTAIISNVLIASTPNIASPVFLQITLLGLLSALDTAKINNYNIRIMNKVFDIYFMLYTFTSIYLLMFASVLSFNDRLKIASSSTTIAILSGLTALYYFRQLIDPKQRFAFIKTTIHFLGFCTAIFVIINIQSRGAFLVTVISCFILSYQITMSSFQSSAKIIVLLGVGASVFIYFGAQFLERFELGNFDSLNQFTSDRLVTQEYMLSQIEAFSALEMLIGKGFGATRTLVISSGLEFPHMDPLLIMFDGGLILLLVYNVFFYALYKNIGKNTAIISMLYLTGLHTNLSLWPNILALSGLFAYSMTYAGALQSRNHLSHR